MTSERRQLWRLTEARNLKQTGKRNAAGRKLYDASPSISLTLEIEDAPWRAIYTIDSHGGRTVISEIRFEPSDATASPAPLPAQLARDLLRPGQALQEAEAALAMRFHPVVLADWHGIDAAQLGIERRGKRRPDYFYAAIASHYVEALASNPSRPLAATASRLPPGYGSSFVRDALDEARKRELLDRPGQGRAGGRLTPQGLKVLRDSAPENYDGPAPAASIGHDR
jgi:hypothetical protein